ncbi:ABC transporter permease [Glycomyces arizonensis]|uniref:ABC transporter permease n=1 Tax=Glycomyces arizonensis TaxID=256035 RepID=UPI00041595EA|nr:FtsX-like permease family protein [Glycomyces arizonensis]
MTAIAWQTLRARWTTFVGSFLALALGAALFTTAGLTLAVALDDADDAPRWFMEPSVVVAGPDIAGAAADDPDGPFAAPPLPAGEPGFVPAEVPASVSSVAGSATVVVDRIGYARFGSATWGHPWSASALHPVELVAGAPPTDADHVVLDASTGAEPGDTVTVATADGPRRFTVSGVIDTPAEPALYFSDATAARLAHDRISAVALLPAPGTDTQRLAEDVAAALEAIPTMRVLTGDERRSAELDPEAGLIIGTTSLVGTTAGVAGFAAAFVVAGTFAFGVVQRRREFALLRAAGATPAQVRRLVVGEALLVGLVAGPAGAALGAVLAPVFAWWLARYGLAPSGFTVDYRWWPAVVACALCLIVASAGSWAASRSAGAIRPVEALRESSVERSGMSATRWILGLAVLGGAIPVAGLMSGPAGPAYLLLVVMLLIGGCALLLPSLMRPFAWLATCGRSAAAELSRAAVGSGRRRYAAAIAPVLITIGLAGGALVGTATIAATEASSLRHQLIAPAMVVPESGSRLPGVAADRLRALPDVAAAVPVKTTTVFDASEEAVRQRTAWYVDGPEVTDVLRVPVADGSFTGLEGRTVAVAASIADAHGWGVGDRGRLWLGDGAVVELRIAAVFTDRLGLPDYFLPWHLATAHSTAPLPDTLYLAFSGEAGPAAAATAAGSWGATVTDPESHLRSLDAQFDRLNRMSLLAVLGAALVYTAVSIANTQAMTAAGRADELILLRRLGATRRQVLRLAAREALTVGGVGLALGGLVTCATLVAVVVALGSRTDAMSVRIPWSAIAAITACCAVIALVADTATTSRLLRGHTGTERTVKPRRSVPRQ